VPKDGVVHVASIREAHKQNKGQLFGTIEADETFIGGLSKNMHKAKRAKAIKGTGGMGKTPLVGIMQRGGDVQVKVSDQVTRAILIPNIAANVQKGSTVYTDENFLLQWFAWLWIHSTIALNTAKRNNVRGDCHTNGH